MRRRSIAVAALALALLSCGRSERAPAPTATPAATRTATTDRAPLPTDPGESFALSIAQGTVGRAPGDLSIGLMSVSEGGDGRLQAGLAILGADERIVVHAGDRIARAGSSIYVLEIRRGGAIDAILCGGRPGCSGGDGVTLLVSRP